MKKFIRLLLFALVGLASSCADHDDPKLAPIDTSKVVISASVVSTPNSTWMNVTEEMTIVLSDIEMSAPKGVLLKSVSLIANSGFARYNLNEKPYSGNTLEFKVPLSGVQGRVNFTLIGNLVKQNCCDAQIIIADNIQKIVFSEEPKFECEGWLYVSVKSKSTSGEEYENSFEVKSNENLTIGVPRAELYWTPQSGTASTLELSLGSGATAWSPNTKFDCKITKSAIGHSSAADPTLKLSIPNSPGSLNAEKLQEYIVTTYSGTWENVTIEPYSLTNVFEIIETD